MEINPSFTGRDIIGKKTGKLAGSRFHKTSNAEQLHMSKRKWDLAL